MKNKNAARIKELSPLSVVRINLRNPDLVFSLVERIWSYFEYTTPLDKDLIERLCSNAAGFSLTFGDKLIGHGGIPVSVAQGNERTPSVTGDNRRAMMAIIGSVRMNLVMLETGPTFVFIDNDTGEIYDEAITNVTHWGFMINNEEGLNSLFYTHGNIKDIPELAEGNELMNEFGNYLRCGTPVGEVPYFIEHEGVTFRHQYGYVTKTLLNSSLPAHKKVEVSWQSKGIPVVKTVSHPRGVALISSQTASETGDNLWDLSYISDEGKLVSTDILIKDGTRIVLDGDAYFYLFHDGIFHAYTRKN